jgi:hypothetical protein
MDAFEYINEILVGKKQLIVDENTENSYEPYVTNRTLSYHNDCLTFANEMNMCPFADKKMQYDFFINTIRSRKRPFVKWIKPEKRQDVEAVKLIYNMSSLKASEAINLLSDEQLSIIKKKTDIGG